MAFVLVICAQEIHFVEDLLFGWFGEAFTTYNNWVSTNAIVNIATELALLIGWGSYVVSLSKRPFNGIRFVSWLFVLYTLYKGSLDFAEISWHRITYKDLLINLVSIVLCIELIKQISSMMFINDTIDKNVQAFILDNEDTSEENNINTGWEGYVGEIVAKLKKTDFSRSSFSIGISGAWGTGKTTFLREIKKQSSSFFNVVEFNPWNSSSSQQLVIDFFETLLARVAVDTRTRDNLRKYAKILVDVSPPSAFSKVFWSLLGSDFHSISSIKEEIQKAIIKLPRPVLILIDDLDRLEKNEVFEVLRLIRTTADFKNVVFVGAYDSHYVVNQLKSCGIEDGIQFLKKIFNLEICLPDYEYFVLPNILWDELKPKLPCGTVQDAVYAQIRAFDGRHHDYYIKRFIKNLRDVKRFANQFLLNLYPFIGNGSLSSAAIQDLFWLEVLSYSDKRTYHRLIDSPYDFIDLKKDSDDNVRRYYLKETISETVSADSLFILKLLFSSSRRKSIDRIIYPNSFNRFFSFRIPLNVLSKPDFDELIKMSDNSRKIQYHHYVTTENQSPCSIILRL